MFDISLIYKVLRRSLKRKSRNGRANYKLAEGKDGLISLLIHDIFGGEILKTRIKNGWHFYNRINGKRIDFTSKDMVKSSDDYSLEDIPSSPEETSGYVEKEEYTTFLMRFINLFEETYGLEKHKHILTV